MNEVIRILSFGGWRNRQPLVYPPILKTLSNQVELVGLPEDAQLLIINHFDDFKLFGEQIHSMLTQHSQLRLVLLSEEPYWDSCAIPDPFTRHQKIRTPAGPVSCTILTHETTNIFQATHIPYFLLTDRRYIEHYRPKFERNAGLSAKDWERHFAQAPIDAVFLAHHRSKPNLAPAFGGDRLRGLSVWRTAVARACRGNNVIRKGLGWASGSPRQKLADWHADKLEQFDLQTRYMSAIENTHQTDYISEKIWDAFAIGAIPLYLAAPRHAVHRLLGPEGWINFYQDIYTIPKFDAGRPIDARFTVGYARQQEKIACLFFDYVKIEAEYDRLRRALLMEFTTIVNNTPT